MSFSGNKAVVGSAVYTNQIGLCSWTGRLVGNRPYFNRSLAFKWDSIRYRYKMRKLCPTCVEDRLYTRHIISELCFVYIIILYKTRGGCSCVHIAHVPHMKLHVVARPTSTKCFNLGMLSLAGMIEHY